MKKLFHILLVLLFTIGSFAQTKVYTKGDVFYMIDTQTNRQYEGIASDVLVVRSLTSSTDYYFHNVNGWGDAQFLNITEIQDETGTLYDASSFKTFYDNLKKINVNDTKSYYLSVQQGLIANEFIVTKFGRHATVGTTLTHVSISGEYQTPTTTQTLEILSSDVDDNPASVGAHKVVIEGLDANFDIQLDTVTMDGTTPVTLGKQFMRVYRGYVLESGAYVTTGTPSHQGQITLRGVSEGPTWFIIDTVEGTIEGFGIGQTQIGTYTIPRNCTAYLITKSFSVESNKPASIYFFKRELTDDITTPYTGIMRLFEQNDGISTPFNIGTTVPLNTIRGPAEVGFFAKVTSTTASVSVEFQLLIVRD